MGKPRAPKRFPQEDEIRSYLAGTMRFGQVTVLAIRDNTGKTWVSIKDFMQRHGEAIISNPGFWRVPECPSSIVTVEGKEILFAGAVELAETLGLERQAFEPTPDPATRAPSPN